jgi:hypothetical protein
MQRYADKTRSSHLAAIGIKGRREREMAILRRPGTLIRVALPSDANPIDPITQKKLEPAPAELTGWFSYRSPDRAFVMELERRCEAVAEMTQKAEEDDDDDALARADLEGDLSLRWALRLVEKLEQFYIDPGDGALVEIVLEKDDTGSITEECFELIRGYANEMATIISRGMKVTAADAKNYSSPSAR